LLDADGLKRIAYGLAVTADIRDIYVEPFYRFSHLAGAPVSPRTVEACFV
jgi:hypothetical protein